jgi:hypothetical protein
MWDEEKGLGDKRANEETDSTLSSTTLIISELISSFGSLLVVLMLAGRVRRGMNLRRWRWR